MPLAALPAARTPTAARPSAGSARLGGCLAAATLVSIALHLVVFWQPSMPEHAAASRAHGTTVMRVLQVPAPRPAPPAAVASLESTLADATLPLDVQPSAGPAPASPGPAAQGYLHADQVDRPAAPLGDWQVAADEALAGRVFEFAARVFVSRSGSIDRIELAGPADAAPPAAGLDALLAGLQHTRMQPALLQGREVASVSTIEFRIEVQRDAF